MSAEVEERLVFFACLFLAIILHEISHGIVALFFGDDTAKRAGRLTLNPIPHIDPFGSIILPAMLTITGFGAFGWAKPVPVDPNKMRNPRRQMLYVGLAGPLGWRGSLITVGALGMAAAVALSTQGDTLVDRIEPITHRTAPSGVISTRPLVSPDSTAKTSVPFCSWARSGAMAAIARATPRVAAHALCRNMATPLTPTHLPPAWRRWLLWPN